MLLFQKRFHEGLVGGSITITFRHWPKARVKPGGRYRVHPIGVVEVEAIDRIRVEEITEDEARASGFISRDELYEYMRPVARGGLTSDSEVFRIRLRHGGDGDRVEIALNDQLTDEDIAMLVRRLEQLDARASRPWTARVLRLIGKHPRIAASQLARKLGRETAEFKVDVRKLKKLGLTQSFEVGYEVSPRGKAFIGRAKRKR